MSSGLKELRQQDFAVLTLHLTRVSFQPIFELTPFPMSYKRTNRPFERVWLVMNASLTEKLLSVVLSSPFRFCKSTTTISAEPPDDTINKCIAKNTCTTHFKTGFNPCSMRYGLFLSFISSVIKCLTFMKMFSRINCFFS